MKKITRILTVMLCVAVMIINTTAVYADIVGTISGTSSGICHYNAVTITKGTQTRFSLAASDVSSKILWTVGDGNILEIEETTASNVIIKAIGVGSTILYAYKYSYAVQTGEYTYIGFCSIPITVTAPKLISINLSYPEVYLNVGESLQNHVAGWYPVDAEVGNIVWTSSNSNIATVSSNGLIKGISGGTTTIYANSNEISASCKVTVSEEIQTSKAGDNISWKLENGVLSFKGTGEMYDYDYGETPWEKEKGEIESIVIGDGITSIGDWSFQNCGNLTSVDIPNGITRIGSWAFAYCSSLTSVSVPDSVTSIGASAFYDCTNLESINISDRIKYINSDVFFNCSRLTSIEIPDGVIRIANNAFCSCTRLKYVKIPKSVTAIGENAFKNCDEISIKGEYGSYAHEYANTNNIPFVGISVAPPLPDLTVEFAETSSRWYFDISKDTYTKNAIIYAGIYDENNKLLFVKAENMVEDDVTSVSISKVNNYNYAKIFEWVNMKPVTNPKLISLN